MIRHNVIATSGRAIEAAGDVDVLLLDKTGTITLGNRMATEFTPAPGVPRDRLADAAQLASLADETPEGRSIVVLAKEKYGLRGREVHDIAAHFVPFSAQTRMSGVDIQGDGGVTRRSIRKGAADSIKEYIEQQGECFLFPYNKPSRTSAVWVQHPLLLLRTRKSSGNPTEGYCQRRYQGTLRASTEDGNQNRDDHRR